MLELTYYPNPVLKQVCREITRDEQTSGKIEGHDMKDLISFMFDTMKKNHGCGLAAPQINLPVRLFVMEHESQRFVVINPTLTDMKGDQIDKEGCLSIPEVRGYVRRKRKLTLNCFDDMTRQYKVEAKDWLARIVQHEYDHLDGKLFIEKTGITDLNNHKHELEELRQKWDNREVKSTITETLEALDKVGMTTSSIT